MPDKAHKWTDKKIKELEKKIGKYYAVVWLSCCIDWDKYIDDMEPEVEELIKAREDAKKDGDKSLIEKTTKAYESYLISKTILSDRYKKMLNKVARKIAGVNKGALDIVNDFVGKIYTKNYNFIGKNIIKDFKFGSIKFDIVDENVINNLIKNMDKSFLPLIKDLDINKDMRWNIKAINSQLLQSIQKGEHPKELAKRLQTVSTMDRKSAIRNARTMITYAQNKGRLDAIQKINEDNDDVVCTKTWIATADDRTRESHAELDGEEVLADEPFSNGLMCPGDPAGEPEEVYNCFIPETKIGADSKIIRSYRHRYDGEVISIKSSIGVNFTCTPNHPILTDRGWVVAKFLNEGDNLIVTSRVNNEVSRRNPNINHAFPRIDTIHQFFDEFGGKRIRSLRVNFHGDIPTTEVEIITQKGFLWSDVYTCIRKRINKFLFKYANSPLMRKCSFMKHFGCIMRATFSNVSGVCKSFSFIYRCVSHSYIHRLRAIANRDVVFSKNTINNLPTDVILPSEIKHRLASKVFLDNVVSVERSNFSGHVYNLQTDDNYYFVNSSITNDDTQCNDIMAIAHNCRCTMERHVYSKKEWEEMNSDGY